MQRSSVEEMVGATRRPDASFWAGKRVLLTGHTGFKGAWLTIWLHRLGAEVTGISLPPPDTVSLFQAARVSELAETHFHDIREPALLAEIVRSANPEIVIHMAAQALVRTSYADPLGTLATNVQGTAHVLDALRGLSNVRVAIAITTDKVYRNIEQIFPYRETDRLGGRDPYSASKAASEIVIASYRDAFLAEQGIAVATARAGNVIGGGDWSVDRLIPDAIRAWRVGEMLNIRRPDAIRPWQHVLDPLCGYLILAETLWSDPAMADAYNFGPNPGERATVRHVIEMARHIYGDGHVQYATKISGPHEAGLLTLETSKARGLLGVNPIWALDAAVERTVSWYRAVDRGILAREVCLADIVAFETNL
ncbi:CDP-glucose 4,6-dehydratase [Pseudolabrys sp.]|uniref:CDP-glucose 4,6-dehydratase n=1 Tax=Pseudolabrys sp. TaxID=1960880 RepID=UPI003D0CF43A